MGIQNQKFTLKMAKKKAKEFGTMKTGKKKVNIFTKMAKNKRQKKIGFKENCHLEY